MGGAPFKGSGSYLRSLAVKRKQVQKFLWQHIIYLIITPWQQCLKRVFFSHLRNAYKCQHRVLVLSLPPSVPERTRDAPAQEQIVALQSDILDDCAALRTLPTDEAGRH